MRIDCPSCAAAYEVPDTVLTARRVMRCARCGAEFTPGTPAGTTHPAPAANPTPALAEMPLALPETVARPDDWMGLSILPHERPVAAPRSAGPVLAAWLLSFALLGAGAWAAIAWRGPIMRAWPPSIRLYVVLGYTR